VRPAGPRVVVETQDAWTFTPRAGFSRKGGFLTYQLGVQDRNLFGTGRSLELRYERGTERSSRILIFQDPQFLAAHTVLTVSASALSDGHALDLGLARPYYALETPHAAGAAFHNALFDTTLYARGEAETRWRKTE